MIRSLTFSRTLLRTSQQRFHQQTACLSLTPSLTHSSRLPLTPSLITRLHSTTGPKGGDVEEEEEWEIQPHWQSMESRVVKRRLTPATAESRSRPVRGRVPRTEEDHWSHAGVYSPPSSSSSSSSSASEAARREESDKTV